MWLKAWFTYFTTKDFTTIFRRSLVIPKEFLRTGRFDELFFIDLPNEEERKEIFKIHLDKRNRKSDEFDLNKLVKEANDFSGAEIESSIIGALYDASKQYANAIGQDFNFNKQSLLALTLAKSTPIFGYFAAKFMETDVFKQAAQRIRENIGGALQTVGQKFGMLMEAGWQKIKGLFGDDKKAKNINKHFKIPSMDVGGYVAKEGLVNVHTAEVIMHLDKVMKQIQGGMGG